MQKKFSTFKSIILTFLILILCIGINLFSSSTETNIKSSEVTHTYLIEIPANAGVCPYVLMSKSHGILHIINNTSCTCPYADHDSYLTAVCPNENSVLALFPSYLRNKIKITVIENFNRKPSQKIFQSIHIAGL